MAGSKTKQDWHTPPPKGGPKPKHGLPATPQGKVGIKLLDVMSEHTDANTGELVQVTRMDKIIAYLRTNVTVATAAAAAGVSAPKLHEWLRIGAEARLKTVARDNGTAPYVRLTRVEMTCRTFCERAEEAMAQGEVRVAGALTRMAEGGTEEVVVTEKIAIDAKTGKQRVIEKAERRAVLAPNVAALNALLSRRWPDTWGANTEEVVRPTGGGVRVSVAELAEVIDGLHNKISRRSAALEALAAKAQADDDIIEAEVVPDVGRLT